MLYIEICRNEARKNGTREAIKKGFFTVWTLERIRAAFHNGNGTAADFKRYMKDNANNCIIKEMSEKELASLYPEY